MDLSEQTHQNR